MIHQTKIYRLPVETDFSTALSIYAKRLATLVVAAVQCWLILFTLVGIILFVQFSPQAATIVLMTGVVCVVALINLLVYRTFRVKRIRAVEDIDKHLMLPTLAVIPEVRTRSQRRAGERVDASLLFNVDSRSSLTEAYRHLRTSIFMTAPFPQSRRLLVTSSQPQEGRTTTAINLALTLTQMGQEVLLIDCDLRRPRVHTFLHLENTKGLTRFLTSAWIDKEESPGRRGETSLPERDPERPTTIDDPESVALPSGKYGTLQLDTALVRRVEKSLAKNGLITSPENISNLKVITSGPIPPNPAELLGSTTMRALLQLLSQRFPFIILDSPPVNSFQDAAILSTMVEKTILVINSGEVAVESAQRAKQTLKAVGANIVGVVLNAVNVLDAYYEHYYASYYSTEEDERQGDESAYVNEAKGI